MQLTELLAFTLQNKASDLHITANNPPIVRIDGTLKPLNVPALSAEDVRKMLYDVMVEEQRSIYEQDLEMDFALAFGHEARFRVNIFTNSYGMAGVFRTIPSKIPSLADLNAPPIFQELAKLERGLILVTGPTGSGKSTTLAALVDHINHQRDCHILTIEDPIEFVHQRDKALINQRELGHQTKSFGRALKSALRQDPDVILVGEMRDHETISLALTAAETGHLVLGTLHTNSAAKTIDRIIDVFPGSDKDMVRAMLSTSLQAVVSQTLLKRKGGGRIAAQEILIGTPAIRNLVRENKVPQINSMIQVGSKFGMRLMRDAIRELVASNLVEAAEAEHTLVALDLGPST